MPHYCVNENKNENGKHQVHRLDKYSHDNGDYDYCYWLPDEENQIALGWHPGCRSAVIEAKREHFQNSDGCAFCSPECHEHL